MYAILSEETFLSMDQFQKGVTYKFDNEMALGEIEWYKDEDLFHEKFGPRILGLKTVEQIEKFHEMIRSK